jgi:hypothetical protein
MSTQRIRKYILQLCVCIVACAVTALSFAADAPGNALHAALQGRWEGALVGPFRSQDVSWHFEVDAAGLLKGYMGPSTVGMPSLPMENLVVTAEQVSFAIPAQHGSFAGAVSATGIAGTWQQGTALPLQMTKKNFAFDLPESAHAALLGIWEMESRGYTTVSLSLSGFTVEKGRSSVMSLEFTETDDGMLAGVISAAPLPPQPDEGPRLGVSTSNEGFAQLGIYRGRSFPLVDVFITEDGFAQFATDNGVSFSGKLINGVLVGDFTLGGRTTSRSFLHAGQRARGFDLDLSDAAWQRLAGRWYYVVFGDDIVLEMTTTEDGKRRGQLIFDEGPLDSDPLLEVVVDGDTVRFTSLTGRTFSGTFTEQDAGEDMVGEYRVNTYPYRVTFTRKGTDH